MHYYQSGDKVRFSGTYLKALGIEPSPTRLVGFVTHADTRGPLSYEVCFESGEGVNYILASATMLEPAQ